MSNGRERRAYRRRVVRVAVQIADGKGVTVGQTVDVSRGGILTLVDDVRGVGTWLRLRVETWGGDLAEAVGVVVRRAEAAPSGIAIALTATTDGWDRFWETQPLAP